MYQCRGRRRHTSRRSIFGAAGAASLALGKVSKATLVGLLAGMTLESDSAAAERGRPPFQPAGTPGRPDRGMPLVAGRWASMEAPGPGRPWPRANTVTPPGGGPTGPDIVRYLCPGSCSPPAAASAPPPPLTK